VLPARGMRLPHTRTYYRMKTLFDIWFNAS
jgi:hypothetical protein